MNLSINCVIMPHTCVFLFTHISVITEDIKILTFYIPCSPSTMAQLSEHLLDREVVGSIPDKGYKDLSATLYPCVSQ